MSAGDRQEEEEEEYGPFGKLVSLNPKFKSVVIPEDGATRCSLHDLVVCVSYIRCVVM